MGAKTIHSPSIKQTGTAAEKKSHFRKQASALPDEYITNCHICGIKVRKDNLKDHVDGHIEYYTYLCDICDNPSKTRNAYVSHMRKHKVKMADLTPEYMKARQTPNTYYCSDSFNHLKKCKFKTTDKNELELHRKACEQNRTCKICNITFNTYLMFQIHNEKKHQDYYTRQCYRCDCLAKTKTHLANHVKKYHNESFVNERTIIIPPTWKCDTSMGLQPCKFRTQKREEYEHHSKVCAFKNKSFICFKCNKKVTNYRNLRAHLNDIHHLHWDQTDFKTGDYEAELRKMLDSAIVKTKETFHCHHCGYQSESKFTFERHSFEHEQTWSYKCLGIGCGYHSKRDVGLALHLAKMHPEVKDSTDFTRFFQKVEDEFTCKKCNWSLFKYCEQTVWNHFQKHCDGTMEDPVFRQLSKRTQFNKGFNCKNCWQSFPCEKTYVNHFNTCRGNYTWKCRFCTQHFKDHHLGRIFGKHMQSNIHKDLPPDLKNQNMFIRTKPVWKCSKNQWCDFTTENASQVYEHEKTCNVGCGICGENFFHEHDVFINHLNRKHGVKMQDFKEFETSGDTACQSCGLDFPNIRMAYRHKLNRCDKELISEKELTSGTCSTCKKTIILEKRVKSSQLKRSLFLSHKRLCKISNDHDYQCGGCLTIFSSFEEYIKHVKNFEQTCDLLIAKELVHMCCWFCDESFKSVKQAVKHMRFKCEKFNNNTPPFVFLG